MSQVTMPAEKANHHPDWSNAYNKVHIRLCSHDQGNVISKKDLNLANAIKHLLEDLSQLGL